MNAFEELQKEFRDKLNRLKELRNIELNQITRSERTERDNILDEMEDLKPKIDAAKHAQDIEDQDSFSDDDFILGDGPDAGYPKKPNSKGSVRTAGDKKDYRSIFDVKGSLSKDGFKSASEFIEVVGSGLFDQRLQRASMLGGVDSTGGFSVPEEMTAEWLDASLPMEIVRPLAQVWPMASATRKIPAWDGEDMSEGELFGGFSMEMLDEEQEATKQTGKVRQIKLEAKKGAIFVDISAELEADGLGFAAQLKSAMQKSIGYGIDKFGL